MSNEKYNSNWKTNLQELSCLPGENKPDVNAAWQKLEARLSTKKRKRKPLVYWLAAASFLTCILITILPGKNNKETANQNLTRQNKQADKKEIAIQFSHEKKNDIVITQLNKKFKPKPITNKIHLIKSYSVPTVTEPVLTITSEKKDSFITSTIIPQTIKSKPIVFSSLKKKMPVVHINDIEKPVDPIEAVAGNNDRPAFRVRLFNRNISAGSPAGYNDNISGLKIKLPPQN
ncbi:MAG: hypothetical protein ABI402_04030 [Ferruginibacter sp.]